MTPVKEYRINPQVNVKKTDDGVLLLLDGDDKLIELSDLSLFIWENLKKTQTLEGLTSNVVKEFDVDYKIAKRDIEEWLNLAVSQKYILIV